MYTEVLKDLSPAACEAISERSREATFSYLVRYGIPQTPADVLTLFDSLFIGAIVWSVGDGYASLTDKSRATEEERADLASEVESAVAAFNRDEAGLLGSHGYI